MNWYSINQIIDESRNQESECKTNTGRQIKMWANKLKPKLENPTFKGGLRNRGRRQLIK